MEWNVYEQFRRKKGYQSSEGESFFNEIRNLFKEFFINVTPKTYFTIGYVWLIST